MRKKEGNARHTVPFVFNSFINLSKIFLGKLSPIAILTCTSLVLIKSTTTPNRSSVPKIPARNPWLTLFLFEWTLSTTTFSLYVTAVGSRFLLHSSAANAILFRLRLRDCSETGSGMGDEREASEDISVSGSGWMTVPPPRGFSTFLMRMGILRRIAYRRKRS